MKLKFVLFNLHVHETNAYTQEQISPKSDLEGHSQGQSKISMNQNEHLTFTMAS